MGFSSARARANASSPHGYQKTGLAACCSRYGLVLPARLLRKSGWRSTGRMGVLLQLRFDLRYYIVVVGPRYNGQFG